MMCVVVWWVYGLIDVLASELSKRASLAFPCGLASVASGFQARPSTAYRDH